ncbi:hypothetical protein PFICI_08253 [Pestalotiopsis fici W106-1]|uniref:PA14 domain-containing protein n=1 Tax=Pestalotiopsis fici (strain W106-1 / CGMCC3.15140) TaxID=1229662 RepID=W3X411_PESFW|nr:uncharacterized protein PFICI_08253 [Pestalotiopsis fici W106-1]ETS80724.1 hypothetical protein PFICI_08253 [Pestalotiopsis fici W106-1]
MHFRVATAFLAAAGVAVNATPVNLISQVECLVVNAVVKALATYSSATPFCSSYLSIPTITSTATATSTVFPTETTTTTTGTDTSTAPAVTVTETASETITTCILSAVQKRGQKTTTTTKSSTTSVSTSKSTALPSCVATFASAQISTACSCLSIPTPSTTVTSTVTVTPTATSIVQVAASATTTPTVTVTATSTSTEIVCPTPSSCDNQGLQWAEYYNSQGDNNDASYSNFYAEVYKTQTPNVQGVTSTIGGIDASGGVAISIYGSSSTFYSDYFALDHKGYLFAVATGTYKFSFAGVDDIAALWLGSTAYAGWTRANANLVVPFHQGYGPGSGSTTIDLVEGQYLPIRVLFGQGQGNAVFQLSVTAPDGTVFLDSSTENSPYIVQYSCDGTTAPAYTAWGTEA